MEKTKLGVDEDLFKIEIILPLFEAKIIKLELPKLTKVTNNVSLLTFKVSYLREKAIPDFLEQNGKQFSQKFLNPPQSWLKI